MTAGITGAIATQAVTPASLSLFTAAKRLRAEGALGSSVRETAAVSDVTESATLTSPCSAIGTSRSISRSTRSDLVVIVSGCLVSSRTSMQERVIR